MLCFGATGGGSLPSLVAEAIIGVFPLLCFGATGGGSLPSLVAEAIIGVFPLLLFVVRLLTSSRYLLCKVMSLFVIAEFTNLFLHAPIELFSFLKSGHCGSLQQLADTQQQQQQLLSLPIRVLISGLGKAF